MSAILDFPPATPEDLEETGRLVQAAGGRWLARTADQRDIAALRAVGADVEVLGRHRRRLRQRGHPGVRPILDMEDADRRHDQIDVNLTGTANVLRVFAPALVRRGGGRIVITSSTQGSTAPVRRSVLGVEVGADRAVTSAALELGRTASRSTR